MNITDQAIESAAKAIQEEWGITPFGELSYQAERKAARIAADKARKQAQAQQRKTR